MEKWEKEGGVKFLKKIGMKTGQIVLDFGANAGHYSIPAAILVGSKGFVYAVDKEQEPLNEMEQKVKALGLKNIKIIKNSGEVRSGLGSESIDIVLLYDVLHYFKKNERKALYCELYRILKPGGLLSAYPKHVAEDFPLMEFQNIHIEDVKQEIIDSDFLFKQKYCSTMSHDNELNSGCVINFKRRATKA